MDTPRAHTPESFRILILGLGIGMIAVLSTAQTPPRHAASPPRPVLIEKNSVNIRMLGATGDGKTDDTAAFLAAIAQAKKERKPIFVPLGQYVISRTISLEQTAIAGPLVGAWPADAEALPSILPAHRDAPAFVLRDGASLAGLDITCNSQDELTTGPAAILISGVGVYVRDTRIRYAWDGILADGANNVGRTNIENVFMVTIRNVGLRMTGTWDVPRLNNVEVWNAGAMGDNRPFRKGVGFHLGKNDLIRMTDCFVFGMDTGFLVESEIPGCKIKGETWGVMNGCATDFCNRGVVVRGDHTLSISGGSFWDHRESVLLESGQSRVRVSGSELKSNGAPVIRVKECDHAVASGCTIVRGMEEHKGPAVALEGGRTVLGLNHIEAFGDGIVLRKGIRSAVIQGNEIDPNGREGIVDETGETAKKGGGGKVAISGNLILD